jgi:anti-anti-sigma factor
MRKALLRRRHARHHPLVRGRLNRFIGKPLTWDIRLRGCLTTVVVTGELDVATTRGLEEQLGPLAGTGSHLILDLAGVRFCDCAGLNLFLRLQQHARAAGGSLHLVAPTASVRRLITVTKLSDVLRVAESPAEVITSLDGAAISRELVRRPADLGSRQQPARRTVPSPARAGPVPEGG